ncbi:hypothetical protein B0F90DRAFT_1727814 [Multifurca ochricompacta]|uniref:Protein artemis n=1 Tax=Multifurca ochricompacta TaxID=376703 RepID=A0AAD4QMY9_9AGAM|nr:hypothetical protein B0F90DRAFT_1727814 [Multifurca ochricompacta]
MPQGTPFYGFIPPFPIRVDEFGTSPGLTAIPALHLLSHTHSDHVLGLSAKSFASTIICSQDAKEMLLKHEVYSERSLRDVNLRDEARLSRTFAHLQVPPLFQDGKLDYSGSKDLLRTLPLNTPTKIELYDNQTITLTLFDANHCPGAVMFLVEGSQGAVLHTGDFRAEPWFLDDIRRNPFLQPYLAPPEIQKDAAPGERNKECQGFALFKTLDTIYLDTACLLSTSEVPTKSDAVQGLVSLMALFPPDTTFFINAWTWGYEDILRAVAHSFQSQIHVDRYKYTVYSRLTDPFLRSLVTPDASKTRFHACERFNRCPHGRADNAVYINPITISSVKWEQYRILTESKLRASQPVSVLLVPLSRHSPLHELRAFVSLFRPARVVPNTLDPSIHGLDALCIPHLFAGCLSSSSSLSSSSFAEALVECDMDIGGDHGDAAMQNLVGDGADGIARAWVESGRREDKLAFVEPFLSGAARDIIRRALCLPPLPNKNSDGNERVTSMLQRMYDAQRIKACRAERSESDEETQGGDEDAHARTARMLFGVPGNSEAAESQGVSIAHLEASKSSRGKHLLVEESRREDTSMPKAALPQRVPTPQVSECGSQQEPVKSNFKNRSDQNFASMRRTLLTTSLPSARFVAHASSPPLFTLLERRRSAAPGQEVPPVADLQHIPLTGIKRAYSQPQSQSSSSLSGSLSQLSPLAYSATKRRKVESWLAALVHEDAPSLVTRKDMLPAREASGVQKGNFLATGLQPGCIGDPVPEHDTETRRAHRRALRSRSRTIEEKLRRALPPAPTSPTCTPAKMLEVNQNSSIR